MKGLTGASKLVPRREAIVSHSFFSSLRSRVGEGRNLPNTVLDKSAVQRAVRYFCESGLVVDCWSCLGFGSCLPP